MNRFRILQITATVVVAALIVVGTALAHTTVSKTSPKAGGNAKTSLKSVKVTFSGQIKKGTITVKSKGGTKVSKGTGGRDPGNVKRLTVALKDDLKAGSYKATWTAVAADGHSQNGSFSFSLKK